MRRPVSLGVVVWLIVGLLVASDQGFLSNLHSVDSVLSAVLAVVVWPLVLFGVHMGI